MITQTVKIRVNEGKAEEFIAAAKTMVAAVKANEAGRTLVYDLYRSASDPNLFMVMEAYADESAVQEHGRTADMAAFFGAIRGILAGRFEVERFEPLAQ